MFKTQHILVFSAGRTKQVLFSNRLLISSSFSIGTWGQPLSSVLRKWWRVFKCWLKSSTKTWRYRKCKNRSTHVIQKYTLSMIIHGCPLTFSCSCLYLASLAARTWSSVLPLSSDSTVSICWSHWPSVFRGAGKATSSSVLYSCN